MKEKQFNSKMAENQCEKNELIYKITEKDNQLKALERAITDLKVER
jgi:predicted nuclease with TOPRIM domain